MIPAKTIVGLQTNSTKRSMLWEIPRNYKILLISLTIILGLGLCSVAAHLMIWSYQTTSNMYHSYRNKTLKLELSLISQKQDTLSSVLEKIIASENKLSLRYGLQKDPEYYNYAAGGNQSIDTLFYILTNPLERNYSEIYNTYSAINHKIKLTNEHLEELQTYIQYKNNIWNHSPTISPASGRFTSKYGPRIHPIFGDQRFHFGLDIAGTKWTEIYASADGKVVSTKISPSFGIVVTIDHGNGYSTRYAHLAKEIVEEGQLVKRYEKIGYMGKSGRSTGIHLHYEVLRDGVHKNPKNYILPNGILVD